MNRISVIIPAFNAENFLGATIRSCFEQTLPPVEVIVVDDGSSDGTVEVCRSLGERIHFIPVANGGVSRARNIGASEASGEIFMFLDSDDVLLPHALMELNGALEKTQAGMAYGMVIERAEPPHPPRLNGFDFAVGIPPIPAQRNFWRGAVITPGSAIVRKDLHEQIGGFVTGYEPLEDRDYWIKCGMLAPAAFCDSIVLDKTWRPSSHGSQHAKRIFRGQRAQRDLKSWGRKRGLDGSWIPEDREILRTALDEALWRREFGILKPLRKLAAQGGLTHWKAALAATFTKYVEPDWIHVEPQVLSKRQDQVVEKARL
jgi:glycosyltransferase involved in cell wall biosynthesis